MVRVLINVMTMSIIQTAADIDNSGDSFVQPSCSTHTDTGNENLSDPYLKL